MHTSPWSVLDPLKLRHLRFLLLLTESGNLGRTAEQMAMTQPAASRLLSELERRFRTSLFDRSRHGMRPLPAATPVLRFAAMVCAEERLVLNQLSPQGGRPAPLRLGTLPTVPGVVIMAMQHCKLLRPNGDISLRQGTLDVLLPLLLDGELDVVVGRFDPALVQPPLYYRKLIDEPLAVVSSPAHELAGRKRISPETLRAQPWVAPIRTSSLFPYFAEIFTGQSLPDDLIECASPVALHSLLQDGRRLGLLALSSLSQPWGEGLTRLSVRLRSSPGALGTYTVDGRMVPPETGAFVKALEMTVAARLS
ncbi:LysR family transcriptional regulator [soil metagenome]